MNGRGAIVGLCMLCALLISAFAAQSASAITGTTAFTCKTGAGGGGRTFFAEHCESSNPFSGSYGHYSIAESTTTEVTASDNHGEAVKLKSTVGGLGVTLTSTIASGTGWMENKVDGSGEHYVYGEGTITFSNVTVSVPNCFVYTDQVPVKGVGFASTIDTEKLVTTSTGQGDGLKIAPKEGGVLARFWMLDINKKTSAEGGKCAISGTYSVAGSLVGEPDGATTKFSHVSITSQNTLKLGPTEAGAKAGLEGALLFKGRDPFIPGDLPTLLSPTTVTT